MIKEVSHLEKLVVNVSPPKPLAPLLLVQAVLRLGVVRPLAELVHGRPDHGVGEVHLLLYTHLLSKADVAQSADMHLYRGQNFIMPSWSKLFFVKLRRGKKNGYFTVRLTVSKCENVVPFFQWNMTL